MLKRKNTNKPFVSEKRDRYAQFFSYEHLLFNSLKQEEFDHIIAIVLGTDSYECLPDFHVPTLDDIDDSVAKSYLRAKRFHLTNLFFTYSRVYDLCRVLGVTNIFDLGCMTINQGLMLLRYSNMSYTGVEANRFYLNDYRIGDFFEAIGTKTCNIKKNAFLYPTVENIAPFADGRIRYIKGDYPISLCVPKNSIGVSMRSLGFSDDKEHIKRIVRSLTSDFDRIIFDMRFDRITEWKTNDWEDFTVIQIGPTYLYATKYSEDIEQLAMMYPAKDGRFSTGIGSFEEYNSPFESPDDFEEKRIVSWH